MSNCLILYLKFLLNKKIKKVWIEGVIWFYYQKYGGSLIVYVDFIQH